MILSFCFSLPWSSLLCVNLKTASWITWNDQFIKSISVIAADKVIFFYRIPCYKTSKLSPNSPTVWPPAARAGAGAVLTGRGRGRGRMSERRECVTAQRRDLVSTDVTAADSHSWSPMLPLHQLWAWHRGWQMTSPTPHSASTVPLPLCSSLSSSFLSSPPHPPFHPLILFHSPPTALPLVCTVGAGKVDVLIIVVPPASAARVPW